MGKFSGLLLKKLGALWLMILVALVSTLAGGCGAAGTAKDAAAGQAPKKVIVAVANEEKPLSFTDNSGKLAGYEVDALREIDRLLPDYEFEIQSVDEDSQQIGLDSGKYVLIAEGLFKTKEREAKYLLPKENVGVSVIKIVTRAEDTDINTLDDLVGRRLVPSSPNGGIYNLLTKYNQTHEKKLDFGTQEGLSLSERYQSIAAGKYDATVMPSFGFSILNDSLHLNLRQSPPVKVNYTYFVLAKDQQPLADAIDGALKTLKENGTMSRLAEKYFGEDIFQYKEE